MYTTESHLSKIAQVLEDNSLSLADYINQTCDRIDEVEPKIQALLPEENRRNRLLKEAADLLKRYPLPESRPPLFGIPVGIKDIIRVDGFPTKAGSKLPEELFKGEEASIVRKLRDAGALILGKTVTTEFAYFEPGPTRNPHNTNHTPGGSSSGSAAAVAAGYCPLAIGTQTIGSVIRPAAYCGIVGFKPTYNRIPNDGIIFFSKSVDQIGIFTQDIEGLKLAASILCTDWNRETADKNFDRIPVLGVPDKNYLDQASVDMQKFFKDEISRLEEAGCVIKQIDIFGDIEDINRRHRSLISTELALLHEEWHRKYSDLYSKHTQQIISEGRNIGFEEFADAFVKQAVLRRELEELKIANNIDLWLSPATPTSAPEGLQATGSPVMNLPWTYVGLPTITIPAGKSSKNLPLGLQFTASFWEDERLVNWVGKVL